jgi:hypothetical protein
VVGRCFVTLPRLGGRAISGKHDTLSVVFRELQAGKYADPHWSRRVLGGGVRPTVLIDVESSKFPNLDDDDSSSAEHDLRRIDQQ